MRKSTLVAVLAQCYRAGSEPPPKAPRPDAEGVRDRRRPPPEPGAMRSTPHAQTSVDVGGNGPHIGGTHCAMPHTRRSQAEGAHATIEIVGNRDSREDVLSYLREKPRTALQVEQPHRRRPFAGGMCGLRVLRGTSGRTSRPTDRGVVLWFIVRERLETSEVEYEGNEEIEKRQAEEAVEVKPNTILSVPA